MVDSAVTPQRQHMVANRKNITADTMVAEFLEAAGTETGIPWMTNQIARWWCAALGMRPRPEHPLRFLLAVARLRLDAKIATGQHTTLLDEIGKAAIEFTATNGDNIV
jgi:hypothetical protein